MRACAYARHKKMGGHTRGGSFSTHFLSLGLIVGRIGHCRGYERPSATITGVAESRVYFIVAGLGESGYTKVGFSVDVRKRLLALQAACPLALKVVANVPGGREVERAVHDALADRRMHGGWFRGAVNEAEVEAIIDRLDVGPPASWFRERTSELRSAHFWPIAEAARKLRPTGDLAAAAAAAIDEVEAGVRPSPKRERWASSWRRELRIATNCGSASAI